MATSPRTKLGVKPVPDAMSTNNQWDVNKALTLAGLFHFLYGAGNACTIPFLTLYFRQLGLTAPLVGIVIGMQHLITSIWAPLCSYLAKTHNKRKVLISGSLLGSAGAGLLLTLVPPLDMDIVYMYCNMSQHPGKLLSATQVPDISGSSLGTVNTVNTKLVSSNKTLSVEAHGKLSEDLVTTGKPRQTYTPINFHSSANIPSMISSGVSGADTDRRRFTDGPFDVTLVTSKNTTDLIEQILEASTLSEPTKTNRNPNTGTMNIKKNPMGNNSSKENANSTFHTALIRLTETPYELKNLSGRWERAQDGNSDLLQGPVFLDGEHQIFLMVLGAVVLWELLAAPLGWMVDDSLFEYLDFVDAADKYENLWIWSYSGASLGVCSIAVFVDQLSCFVITNTPRFAVHFYGYASLITLALLVSVFFPIYVSKKTEHVNKTFKALNLIGNDGRTILSAVTVFLTGAIGSTVQNFLFWQMQDQGSSELYMGLSIAIGLVAEIFLNIFKSKLLRALSGSGTVALSLSCLAAQLLYYSFLWSPWAVLPIQILCAFSNGALWWAVNMLANDIATPGTERSLHLVLQGLSCGCGASLGSFAGGFVVNSFGLPVLYRACSIALVLWLVLFLIVQSRLPRQKRINYSRLLAADSSDMSDSDDKEDDDKERDWLVKAMKDENFNRNW
ncbi:major facilitator superfamily domain-containing protein 6-like isoform X2 [Anolis carolinensis]|uniref:Major facilitator superfamily domain containing 6 like n=1 Tax=Anolis carolinensis TaxID=28377 RepID=A0A803TKR4_ANOCA|nr:PREDICTED: major facilitator superfamily domain-containing protein 6-like isoform X1 [Anolis carolinensis]|eukprot:XP_008102483.1 PREDICTED: major facilitator superfamily domain-containing protein 6-like isoform X1 [Anolis carolinensis]